MSGGRSSPRSGPFESKPCSLRLPARPTLVTTLVVASLGLIVTASLAQTDEVPDDLQAALFEKIFRYVKTLERPDDVVVLTVFEEDERRKARQIADAFLAIGVDSRPVEMKDLSETISERSVLYVLPSASSAEIAALCEEHRLLSLSGSSSTVESGGAAVGVRLSEGRPQILVNMTRLQRDGQRISADLLKLAKVIH